jgi:hypothetical protein
MMKSILFSAFAATAAAQQSFSPAAFTFSKADQNPTTNTSSSTACAAVHYIVVRASTEPPGQGIIGTLATLSSTRFPGSTVEALDYPAVLSPYNSSSYNGTLELTKRLKDYVDKCSSAKVVLMGYSQGAHVVGDVLCGGGENPNLGPDSPPIDKKYADKVVAMVQMGDPRFMVKKSFDVGSATEGGVSYTRTMKIGGKVLKFVIAFPKAGQYLLRSIQRQDQVVL